MSTYTDVCKKVKESIVVDYHTRITPQEVNFINPKNKFTGEIHATGNNLIDGAKIEHAYIKDTTLDNVFFKNGVNLEKIETAFESLSNEISNEVATRTQLFEQLGSECAALSTSLDEEISRATAAEQLLSDSLNVESCIRHNADKTVLDEAKAFTLKNRHFKLNKIADTSYAVKTEDFAINTYKAYSPNGYVFMDGEDSPIGRLQNAIIEDDNRYVSFEVQLFAGTPAHELTAYGKMLYKFTLDENVIYSHVGGYRIKWTNCGQSGIPEFLVDSANDAGFFNTYFEGTHEKAGLVFAKEEDIDSFLTIKKCDFITTNKQLSNFIISHPYSLSNGMKLDVKCLDGSAAELSLLNNTIYIADGIVEKNYLGLSNTLVTRDDEKEFARIFEGGIHTEGQELHEIEVNIGEYGYLLNRGNRFDARILSESSAEKHLAYISDEKRIKIFELRRTYKYKFDDAENNNMFIPGEEGKDFNVSYADEYDAATVVLDFVNEKEHSFLNRKYILQRKQNSLNLYSFKDSIGEHFVELTFDKLTKVLDIYIKRIGSGMSTTVQLKLDIEDVDILTATKLLAESLILNVFAPAYDSKIKTVVHSYCANIDVKSGRIGREDVSYACRTNTGPEFKDVIVVKMPDKKDDIPGKFEEESSQFILNFKILEDGKVENMNKLVLLKLIPSGFEDIFFYHNRKVKNMFLVKNAYCSVKFTEIQPHKYMIEDMDDTELDFKVKCLHDRLSADELSVGNELCSIHNDISAVSAEIATTIHRNRNDVSFFGDVYLSDVYDVFDRHNHLSSLIMTNPEIALTKKVQYGFMFRCKAPAGQETKLFRIWNEDTGSNVYFKDNMYFVVTKKMPDDTVPLDQLKYSDVDIFNNFDIDVANLSTYVYALELSAALISGEVDRLCSEVSNDVVVKYEKLIADDNFISGEIGKICSDISNDVDAKYNDITSTVSSLSNTVSSEFVNRLKDNDIRGNNTFYGDVKEVNVTALNLFSEYLSAVSVEFTDLTVHGTLVAKDQRTDVVVLHLSATSADIDSSTLLTAYVKNATIDEAAIRSLSADSKNIKLIDRETNLNDELSDLEAKTDFLLSVSHRSMEYFGDVKSIDYPEHKDADLHNWLIENFKDISELSGGLKQGFTFRLSAEQKLYKPDGTEPYIILNANDYFIVKRDVRPLESIKLEDLAIIYDAKEEGKQLCTMLSVKIDSLELSAALISGEVNRLCSEISNDLTTKYEKLTTDDSFISSETDRLCSEISSDITAKYSKLTADDNFISSETGRLCSEISNDLTAKYEKLVDDDSFISGEVDRLCSEISDDVVAKYQWLSSETDRLCSEISNDLTTKYKKLVDDDSFISGEVGRLCAEISNDLTAKYENLTTDDSFISGEVGRLCTEISNDLIAKYDWLSAEIESNDNDIKYLSSELSDYHNTLSGIDRKGHEQGDIYTDNLMITSMDKITEIGEKHKKYYLTMLSGTLVLKEITE